MSWRSPSICTGYPASSFPEFLAPLSGNSARRSAAVNALVNTHSYRCYKIQLLDPPVARWTAITDCRLGNAREFQIIAIDGSVDDESDVFRTVAFFCRSSLSVGFNSTSVVILEDFVKGCFKMKPSDRCSIIFVKTLVVLLGLLALSFLLLIEKLGGVLSVSLSLLREDLLLVFFRSPVLELCKNSTISHSRSR